MLCADLVDVRWRDRGGKGRRAVANLEDISTSGACLQLDEQIAAGTSIRVSHSTGDLNGEVRYCVFRDIGYFVGIAFHPGSSWSQEDFKPMHMLDPRSLIRDRRDGRQRISERNNRLA